MSKEKRRFRRYHKKVPFELTFEGKQYVALTEDYSLEGLSVLVEGAPPIKPGSVIELDISNIKVRSSGKVMRVSKSNGGIRLGLSRMGMLYGSLGDFDVSDLLLGFQRSTKTGVLHIKRGNIQKSIYFKSGDMIFATSNLSDDWLGNMLMREGRITLAQFNASSEVVINTKKRHGAVLVEMGYLKPQELFSAVKRSVENIVLSVMAIRNGDFFFKEGPLPTDEVITLELSTATLIYRGIKAIEDIATIRSMCPRSDAVLYYSSDPLDLFQDIHFIDDDRKVLAIVDGHRTFKQIVEASELQTLQAMRAICALLGTRIIEILDRESTEDINATDIAFDEIFKEHHDNGIEGAAAANAGPPDPGVTENAADKVFKTQVTLDQISEMYSLCEGSDYYRVLNVDKRATSSDIKKAYYQRAKDFHPDKHYHLPTEVKDKLNIIFTTITTAYSTLVSPSLKMEYDRNPIKSRTAIVDPAERAVKKFEEGLSLMTAGKYEQAASVISEAAYLMSEEPKYHFHAGVALSRSGHHKEAERTLQRALKLDPFNPDYIAELGHIYFALGFTLRAKSGFEKALSFNPTHKRAIEGLALIPKEK